MLGIGDIVMPGLLLCFVLRYDNYKKQANGEVPGPGNVSGRMQRVSYFHCTLIGYFVGKWRWMCFSDNNSGIQTQFWSGTCGWCAVVAGLLTATVASRIHRAAQPALLYLVPFTLLPLLTMAYLKVRSGKCYIHPEINIQLWNFYRLERLCLVVCMFRLYHTVQGCTCKVLSGFV